MISVYDVTVSKIKTIARHSFGFQFLAIASQASTDECIKTAVSAGNYSLRNRQDETHA